MNARRRREYWTLAFFFVLQNESKSPANAPDSQTMPQFISNSLTGVSGDGVVKIGRML